MYSSVPMKMMNTAKAATITSVWSIFLLFPDCTGTGLGTPGQHRDWVTKLLGNAEIESEVFRPTSG